MPRRRLPLVLLLLVAGCGGVQAAASDCVTLDVRTEGREIAATVNLEPKDEFRVVLVHEGHVAWRGTKRGPLHYTHRMKDYEGPDRITVRASGPGGRVCTTSGELP